MHRRLTPLWNGLDAVRLVCAMLLAVAVGASPGASAQLRLPQGRSVQCAQPEGARVHRRYRGRDDVEARLGPGEAVHVLERRAFWRKIAYSIGSRGATGWVEAKYLVACNAPAKPPQVVRAPAVNQTAPSENCLFGCPVGAPANNTLLARPIYTLSSNSVTKFADWVAYRVILGNSGPRRKRNWQADPDLPAADTLERPDYDKASALLGVDHGHQAPLATFAGSPFWKSVNYLSNITPQSAALNQGAWQRLEQAERRLAREGLVWVLTGPLYERPMPPLPKADETHTVPSGYWKIVAVIAQRKVATFVVALDQTTEADADFCDHELSVDGVEARAHLDVFPQLEKTQQAALEAAPGTLGARLGCSVAPR